MSRNREPKNNAGLPHSGDRDNQPYAREVEDYSGETVKPPAPQTGTKERSRRR